MEEENELNEAQKGITLKELFMLIWRNIILIVIIICICTGGGLIYALTQKPTYTMSKSVVVACIAKASNGTSDYNDFTLTKASLPTLSKYFVSDEKIYTLAQEKFKVNNNGNINIKNVHIDYSSDATILKFSYTDSNLELAKQKLDAYLQASKEIVEETNENGEAVNFVYVVKLNLLQDTPTLKINSKKKITVLVSALIGIILAVIVVLIRYMMDDTIKSKEEVEKITGLKLFASLEEIDDDMLHRGNEL